MVLRFIEEALQGHSRERMDELIAPDYIRHMPGGQHRTGRDPLGQSAAEMGWAACPDWSYEIEVLLAEGELVAVRVSAGGTHTREAERGPWHGLTPGWHTLQHDVDGDLSGAGWQDRRAMAR